MDNKKLFVASLPFSFKDEDLESLFSAYGTIVSARIATDKMSGRSKGFGFVEFETAEMAEAAIKALDGSDCQGRQLVVNVAKPREDKPRRDFGGNGGGNHGGGFRGNNNSGGFRPRENSNRW